MDSATYTALTGKTVSTSQIARFEMQKKVAKKKLERMLGYPLCPDKWDNQYIERGKTDGCYCSISDDTELEPADDVVNAYRFFRWNPRDTYLHIDPATAIHAVKIVHGDITTKTFDSDEYRPQWNNSCDEPYATYLGMSYGTWRSWFPHWYGCYANREEALLMAVDADWGFATVPLDLKQAWADLIANSLDDRKDIRSESAGTHSYTRFTATDPLAEHASVLNTYAGPNGVGVEVGVL